MAKKDDGITFNLVSRHKLDELSSEQKLKFILSEVKKGKILVLEHGLTPMEKTNLIENTMKEIEQDTFIGVELEGYSQDNPSFFQRLFGISKRPSESVRVESVSGVIDITIVVSPSVLLGLK